MQANFSFSSFSAWFLTAWADLTNYFSTLNTTQWGVLAFCAVTFGFLCLKGNPINR